MLSVEPATVLGTISTRAATRSATLSRSLNSGLLSNSKVACSFSRATPYPPIDIWSSFLTLWVFGCTMPCNWYDLQSQTPVGKLMMVCITANWDHRSDLLIVDTGAMVTAILRRLPIRRLSAGQRGIPVNAALIGNNYFTGEKGYFPLIQ